MDDRKAGLIQGLLAKAESTDSDDERLALIGKAQELMTKYGIDSAKLQAAGSAPAEEVTSKRINVVKPRQRGGRALVSIVGALARANNVVTIAHSGGGLDDVTLIGFPAEIRTVEMMFESLTRQLEHAVTYAMKHRSPGDDHGTRFRVSYMHGWANTVAERLYAARTEAVAAATSEDSDQGSTSTAVVLRSREAAVKAETTRMFPRLGSLRSSYRPGVSGYRQGQSDGRNAALGGEIGNSRHAALTK